MVEPNAWLADFEARVSAARQKAAQFSEQLKSAGATASSRDGSVTVTVAPNGSLAGLRISDDALRGSGARLAEEIMRTAQQAQREAARNVTTAFTELGGKDSEVTTMLTGFVPPDPQDDEDESPQRFAAQHDQAPRELPGRRPRRSSRPDDEPDDDFEFGPGNW